MKHGQEEKKLKILIYPALLLALITVAAMAISIGAVPFTLREIGAVFLELSGLPCGVSIEPVKKDILLQLRMPRVVLAGAVGAALATSGAAFQGLFRNPMADSYVIGVSSGAALGAVAAMLVGLPAAWGGVGAVPLFAFAGGAATLILVYQMARVGNEVPVMPLLLAGIAVAPFCRRWSPCLPISPTTGCTRSSGSWAPRRCYLTKVKIMVPYALLGLAPSDTTASECDAFGEETAHHLGIYRKGKEDSPGRLFLMVAAAVSTSASSACGLVVPRYPPSSPDHRHLRPFALLAVLPLLDTLGRTIIALPVGIITALLAPFYLLLRRRKTALF